MVKLADFGIAKAAEQSDDHAGRLGARHRRLPRAGAGPRRARRPAAPDIYALGVVAYQLLAGRLPYDAASLTDLARLQEAGPPPRLDELAPVPGALALAVAKALHRDPAQRYADATEMETALRDGLRGRAPDGGTEATWAMAEDDTAATRAMSATSATSAMPRSEVRRRLEPLDEPPPPPRRAPRRAPAAPPARRERGGGLGKWIALLLVLALVVAGFAGYQALQDSGGSGVQLREEVDGQVDQAVDELRGLIEDNTAN